MNKIKKLCIVWLLCAGAFLCFDVTVFAQDTVKVRKPDKTVYTTYDQPPVPPGGDEGYLAYLKENLTYPETALKANAQGTVHISITVDTSGILSDVHIVRDQVGYGCGEEAVRVIKEMPPWTPGKMNGVPVKVKYVIPVMFRLK